MDGGAVVGEEDHHQHHHGTTFNATTTQVIGGGMSRAAKKRAKKKKKDKQGGGGGAKDFLAPGGDDNDNHLVGETSSVNKKKKKENKQKVEKEAKQHHDSNDNDDDDDDDEIGMQPTRGGGGDFEKSTLKSCLKKRTTVHDNNDKNKGNNNKNNNNNTLPLLDGGLTSLVKDILLVDDDSNNRDTKDATGTKSQSSSSLLSKNKTTARERARMTLAFLLAPAGISVEEFYQDYWEKKPLHVKCQSGGSSSSGKNKNRLDGLLSLASIRKTLREHTPLYLGKDLNVTRYQEMEDGVKRRQTLDASLVMPASSKNDKNAPNKNKSKNNNKGDGDDKNTNDNDDACQQLIADPDLVWKHYEQDSCSIRLLCPHDEHFSNNIHILLSLLELEFGCMVGANAYLTPPHASQGFAPHYDDIEAFCLQLQGHKRWKVYEPWNKAERLPRVSSGDYTEADLVKHNANMVLDIILSPGDLLYMPRGWIHQACTLPSSSSSSSSSKSSDHDNKRKRNKDDTNDDDQHSLHLTVSAMQHWSWVDLMEVLLPQALEAAANSETSIALRQGLPRQFLSYMGAIYDNGDRDCPEPSLQLLRNRIEAQEAAETATTAADGDGGNTRHGKNESGRGTTVAPAADMEQLQQDFRSEAKKRIMRVAKEAMDMVDASCDQLAKQFLSSCQPPALTQREVQATSRRYESGEEVDDKEGGNDDQQHQLRLRADDQVRLVRPGVARLVVEDGMAVLYHCLDNSRVYHANPLCPMEFEMDDAAAMEQLLLTTEPDWILIADLFHDSIQDKVGVAQSLYDEGILVLRRLYEKEEEQADEENQDA